MVSKTDKLVLTDGAGNTRGELTAVDGQLLFNGVAIAGSKSKKAKKSSPSITKDEAYAMNKKEQEAKLRELGMSKDEIDSLRYEKDRVNAILKKNN